MKRAERFKKSDIMKRLREKDATKPVSIKEFCWLLRQNGLSHTQGYFHYTTLGRLKKMLAGEDVGEKGKRRLLFLSASSTMNDTEETKPGVYLASFSYGKEEEVAMWTNYGVPKREAVRIRFPMAAMTQWDKANKSGKIVIYVREDDDKNKPFHALDAKPAEIYLADVAYYGRNDLSDKVHREGVRYRGMGFGFKEDKWRGQIKKTNDALLFKKRGWAYEHEVRLIVRFNDVTITERHKTIALPFDSLYDAMLADTHTNVMTGPWYDERKSQFTDIAGIRNPSRSSFEGELRMRSNCDWCDMRKNGNECQCPNAEWKLWM